MPYMSRPGRATLGLPAARFGYSPCRTRAFTGLPLLPNPFDRRNLLARNRAIPCARSPMTGLPFFTGFLKRPRAGGLHHPQLALPRAARHPRGGLADVAKLVVELGPGTGGTTRALLRAMQPDAKLLAIEINPHFVDVLARSPDPRLIVHHGSAADLRPDPRRRGPPAPDVILSGIPFSTMPRALGLDDPARRLRRASSPAAASSPTRFATVVAGPGQRGLRPRQHADRAAERPADARLPLGEALAGCDRYRQRLHTSHAAPAARQRGRRAKSKENDPAERRTRPGP